MSNGHFDSVSVRNACALEQFTHLKCHAARVKMNESIPYLKGAGVSGESGIPTFRGWDGF